MSKLRSCPGERRPCHADEVEEQRTRWFTRFSRQASHDVIRRFARSNYELTTRFGGCLLDCLSHRSKALGAAEDGAVDRAREFRRTKKPALVRHPREGLRLLEQLRKFIERRHGYKIYKIS